MKHIATWPITEFDVINGFDIHDYAPPPHSEIVSKQEKFISNSMLVVNITQFIRKRAPKSPVTIGMILGSSEKYNLGPDGTWLMMALMQQDTMFGTTGEGAKLHNPGNVGDDDAGHTRDFGTWESGVDAVAAWLDRHRA